MSKNAYGVAIAPLSICFLENFDFEGEMFEK